MQVHHGEHRNEVTHPIKVEIKSKNLPEQEKRLFAKNIHWSCSTR